MKKLIVKILILVGLVSIFVPLVHLDLPLFGKSSYSVFSLIRQAVMQDEGGKGLSVKDLYSIQNDIKKNLPDKYKEKLNDKSLKFYTALFSISVVILVIGFIAYFLVILFGIMGMRRTVMAFSLISASCAAYSLIAIYLLNRSMQKAMLDAQAKMADKSYGSFVATLFQQVSITPGRALYILAISMALVFLFSFFVKPKKV